MAATKSPSPKTPSTKPKLRSSHGASLGATTAKKTAKKATKTASTAERIVAAAKRRAVVAKTSSLPPPKESPKKKKADAKRTESLASDDARRTAMEVAIAAFEKKAAGIEILDVAGRVDYADFLVLMTGRSDRQVAALAGSIEEALRKKGTHPLSVEGLPLGQWVLMDFGDVVVHIFQEETRGLYDLDGLWMDASRLPVPETGRKAD